MKNEIVHRIYDFLKEYPPFNLLPKEAIMNISANVMVKFIPDNTLLFEIGEIPPPMLSLIHI